MYAKSEEQNERSKTAEKGDRKHHFNLASSSSYWLKTIYPKATAFTKASFHTKSYQQVHRQY
jgi:hypothetical protein